MGPAYAHGHAYPHASASQRAHHLAAPARARPAPAPVMPGFKRKLAGAVLGIAGITAAALQAAGVLPAPGAWVPQAVSAVETRIETLAAIPADRQDKAPSAAFGPEPELAASIQTAPAQTASAQTASTQTASAAGRPRIGADPLANGPSWVFEPARAGGSFVLAEAAPEAAPEPVPTEAHIGLRVVPLPKANPLAGLAPEAEALPPVVAKPQTAARSPLLRMERQMASLPPDDRDLKDAPAPRGSNVAIPGPSDRYAVYDISAKTVYMPSGERLEAHSGYGAMFDDPRHVSKKMRGPTPPNVYNLRMREALFHGVEAIRMLPVDEGRMFGRDGILAHTYMLGPRGDSNGCVSFRDYEKFLAAFKRGEVKQMIVVAKLENQPASNPLLSWLMPRR